jgi:hypothetical protein
MVESKSRKVPPNDVLQEMKSMQEPHNHHDTKHLVGDGQEKRPAAACEQMSATKAMDI